MYVHKVGHIVPTKELKTKYPWIVKTSTKSEGRCYFYNQITEQSVWSLPPKDCEVPPLDVVNKEFDFSPSNPPTSNNKDIVSILSESNASLIPIHYHASSSILDASSAPSTLLPPLVYTESNNNNNNDDDDSVALLDVKKEASCMDTLSSLLPTYIEVIPVSKKLSPVDGPMHSSAVSSNLTTSLPTTPDFEQFPSFSTNSLKEGSAATVTDDDDVTGAGDESSLNLPPKLPLSSSSTSTLTLMDNQQEFKRTISSSSSSASSFQLIQGLGRGGFASVVEVMDIKHPEKRYAMKVSKKIYSPDPLKVKKSIHNLENEVKIMRTLKRSPFVIHCHDCFENSSSVFFILDLVAGGDLYYHLLNRSNHNAAAGSGGGDGGGGGRSSISGSSSGNIKALINRRLSWNGPFSSNESRRKQHHQGFKEHEASIILAELYLAIEHLHNHGIVHRDIKVENVMLDIKGHVKLIDFGFAMQIHEQVQPMPCSGSLNYMAPELLVEKIGGRHTDWWAYGVLAYELLTGSTPWSNTGNDKVIKHEILQGVTKPTSSLLTSAGRKLIIALLNNDFKKRIGTESDCEIKSLSFFKKIDWEKVLHLECPPAFVPGAVKVNSDTQMDSLEFYYDMIHTQKDDSDANCWYLGIRRDDSKIL